MDTFILVIVISGFTAYVIIKLLIMFVKSVLFKSIVTSLTALGIIIYTVDYIGNWILS